MLFYRRYNQSSLGIGTAIKRLVWKRILLLIVGYILTIILTTLLGPAGAAISQYIQNRF